MYIDVLERVPLFGPPCICRIIGIFHFSIFQCKLWALIGLSPLQLWQRHISLLLVWRIRQDRVTYRTHVALRCECSVPTAEWLDSSVVQGMTQLIAHEVGESIFCRDGWRRGSSQITLGRICSFYATMFNYNVGLLYVYRVQQNKVAPCSFFGVFSATVSNFNLKLCWFIFWNVVHLSAKSNVILLKNDEVIDFLTWPPTDISALKNDSSNVCFRARRFLPTATSFAFCCRPRSINTLANFFHCAEGPALVWVCSYNCLRF